jgi:hypothetical protein
MHPAWIFLIWLGWLLLGTIAISAYSDCSIVFDKWHDQFFDPCNPTWLYDNYNVNFVGVIVLTILFNLILLPFAIVYWPFRFIRFIMTVGRKR